LSGNLEGKISGKTVRDTTSLRKEGRKKAFSSELSKGNMLKNRSYTTHPDLIIVNPKTFQTTKKGMFGKTESHSHSEKIKVRRVYERSSSGQVTGSWMLVCPGSGGMA